MRSIKHLMDISNRKAIITGGTGHVGLAVGQALVELGANVSIIDLDSEECEKRASALSSIGPGRANSVPCDLSDENATRRAIQYSIGIMGGLDILVHCAALVGTTDIQGWARPFDSQTVDAWDSALRVNVTSAFIIVQEAQEYLEQSSNGSIIFIGSIYGHLGPDLRLYSGTDMSNPAGYGVTKAGLTQLGRYLSTVLAPRVRVNSISPGGILRGQSQLFIDQYEQRTPLQRMCAEEDIKGAIAYLSSDMSAYVTGHNLIIDGGWSVW